MELGTQVLSDAELVAVLLRTGTRGQDAIMFSRELLNQSGGLRGLMALGIRELRAIKGLGAAKASAILAAGEMTRRALREEIIGKSVIRDSRAVMDYLTTTLRDRKREVFKVIFLNKANRIVAEKDLFEGDRKSVV